MCSLQATVPVLIREGVIYQSDRPTGIPVGFECSVKPTSAGKKASDPVGLDSRWLALRIARNGTARARGSTAVRH
jgi:hypothetical protein